MNLSPDSPHNKRDREQPAAASAPYRVTDYELCAVTRAQPTPLCIEDMVRYLQPACNGDALEYLLGSILPPPECMNQPRCISQLQLMQRLKRANTADPFVVQEELTCTPKRPQAATTWTKAIRLRDSSQELNTPTICIVSMQDGSLQMRIEFPRGSNWSDANGIQRYLSLPDIETKFEQAQNHEQLASGVVRLALDAQTTVEARRVLARKNPVAESLHLTDIYLLGLQSKELCEAVNSIPASNRLHFDASALIRKAILFSHNLLPSFELGVFPLNDLAQLCLAADPVPEIATNRKFIIEPRAPRNSGSLCTRTASGFSIRNLSSTLGPYTLTIRNGGIPATHDVDCFSAQDSENWAQKKQIGTPSLHNFCAVISLKTGIPVNPTVGISPEVRTYLAHILQRVLGVDSLPEAALLEVLAKSNPLSNEADNTEDAKTFVLRGIAGTGHVALTFRRFMQ